MWFIDDSLVKNKNYYLSQNSLEDINNISLHIFYGGTLFSEIFNRKDVWDEISTYLSRNKHDRNDELLNIPDFDTSPEILTALKKLKNNDLKLYEKLISSDPKYVQLRKELFPTGQNLSRV